MTSLQSNPGTAIEIISNIDIRLKEDKAMIKKYEWEKYLIIESEFIEAKKYISFDRERNYEADSPFLHNEIVLLGAQVEISMKKLISYHNPVKGFSPYNIGDYRRLLLMVYPEMESYSTSLVNSDITFSPFKNWKNGKLAWWDAYSSIKHGSSRLPKLEHALNLLAAYEILIHLVHCEETKAKGDEYIFYSFREMPGLLRLNIESELYELDDGMMGYGFEVAQYNIIDDIDVIKNEIEEIRGEREENRMK